MSPTNASLKAGIFLPVINTALCYYHRMSLKLITLLLKISLSLYKWYSLKKAKDEDLAELQKLRSMLVDHAKFNGHVEDVKAEMKDISDDDVIAYFNKGK